MLPALHHLLGFVDHHCHSLRADWAKVTDPYRLPGWRQCFTEAAHPDVLERDVPHLLGYRHFLAAFGESLDLQTRAENELVAARDELADDPYLRRLFDDAGTTALLVDTGFGGAGTLDLRSFRQASGRDVREVTRLESVVEGVLAEGRSVTRSLPDLVDAVLARLDDSLASGAVGIKSILAYRAGLHLPDSTSVVRGQALARLDRRRQAQRFDDPVLAPFLVREAAALAADRGVPLQFHTGFGDPDIDLPRADPALLRPLFHDVRTEGCPVVLLHCHPYVRGAAYLAGTYPQVYMDLSLAIPQAEPIAASLVREALALCPATKLLAASDGHSYPEMHWWGAVVWDRALREVLEGEMSVGALDEAAAVEMAARILSGNARGLYGLAPSLTP